MPLLDKAIRVAKAAIKEATTPESFVSGQEFEKHVLKMFPENEWTLVKRTQSYASNEERYEEKSKEPDFLFRHEKSNRSVSIECKFRSSTFKDKIEWCKYYQFKRYKEIDDKYHNVYIILGFGGTASMPERIYRIPMSKIKYTGIFPNVIREYEIGKDHRFTLINGELR